MQFTRLLLIRKWNIQHVNQQEDRYPNFLSANGDVLNLAHKRVGWTLA